MRLGFSRLNLVCGVRLRMRMESKCELIMPAIYPRAHATCALFRLTKEDIGSITVTSTPLLVRDGRID